MVRSASVGNVRPPADTRGLLRWHGGIPVAWVLRQTMEASQGARPYDLRHAAVSLWLNEGIPATQVAEWAGHSVHVLLKVYAKCIEGQDDAARRRIEAALGEPRAL